jgi:homoserine kinase
MAVDVHQRVRAAAFAPGSIGNVGPGFDVLGLAVEGLGDTVALELVADGPSRVDAVRGRDAERVPHDVERNSAALAAREYLRRRGLAVDIAVTVDKGLPFAGGLGGSAASSVAGAYAASLLAARLGRAAADGAAERHHLLAAALAGESAVSGRHLDNIGPSLLGGLVLARSVDPIDVVALPVAAPWWVALWTPGVTIETKAAREMLPATLERNAWVQQMANTAALVHAFASGDGELLARALDDRYAEPRRAALVPGFAAVKRAARGAGAFGGSISGSGPTVFAVAADEPTAQRVAAAMQRAGEVESSIHAAPIARRGARPA